MHILLIEDDPELPAHIPAGRRRAGHAVVHAADGLHGARCAIDGDFDVIVLDRMLPKLDGIAALGLMRKQSVGAPVLLLTARGSIRDRVEGLNAGADDYLV